MYCLYKRIQHFRSTGVPIYNCNLQLQCFAPLPTFAFYFLFVLTDSKLCLQWRGMKIFSLNHRL